MPQTPPEPVVSEYTVFTVAHQRVITALVALATLASPITAILYLPLVPRLAEHFSVSIQQINLTITIYIVFQAIAPLLLSTHADSFGRRPVYLASFSIYTIASLGLAVNRSSYAALATLRAIQSLGASAVLSVCYGTIADLRPTSSRGTLIGTVLACSNLGTAVGPVIGGAIASSNGNLWWAFWTMLIFSGSMLVALALLMPETARNIVGNGSIQDRSWNRPLLGLMWAKSSRASDQNENVETDTASRKLAFKSPFQALLLVRFPEAALILWIVGSLYALWYTVQASIPIVFSNDPYDFNGMQVGLCYLPGATGVVICMYLTGKAMDYNYRVLDARQSRQQAPSSQQEKPAQNLPTQSGSTGSHDISDFPIERARSRYCISLSLVLLAFTIAYGWSIEKRLHPAAPLVFQCCIGFLCTWILNMFNTLLVDIFPATPSTAATAGNLARCGMAAAAVAILDPLTEATNRGWFFTILGISSSALGSLAIAVLNRKGMKYRQKRERSRDMASG